MHESTQVTPTRPGEVSIAQSPGPQAQTARQASAFKEALTQVVDRLRLLLAKVAPLIKSKPWIAWSTGIGLVVLVAFGAWYLHRSRTSVPANPEAAEIAKLENLARDAYKQHHYVVPVETSALAYSKRVLALDPSNNYSRMLLENSVTGGKYQVQQALKRKDFARAHRTANAMGQLLPGRKDIAELKQDIRIAEKGPTASRRQKPVAKPLRSRADGVQAAGTAPRHQKAVARQKPAPKPVPKVSFTAYHMHSEKAPADHGPYCLGVLSVAGQRLRYAGRSASGGQKVHKLDFACADVREIKKNARVASHQGGFHVRTVSANMNFAPRDSSLTHVSTLASACSN